MGKLAVLECTSIHYTTSLGQSKSFEETNCFIQSFHTEAAHLSLTSSKIMTLRLEILEQNPGHEGPMPTVQKSILVGLKTLV